ncbi:MAG: hypothetical protein V7K98_23340 [Nostoc sp.]|uniref:hypothetical protein n=1 Tax=Nostoc sp. TaxID=1180 RepID=UPI002FF82AE1
MPKRLKLCHRVIGVLNSSVGLFGVTSDRNAIFVQKLRSLKLFALNNQMRAAKNSTPQTVPFSDSRRLIPITIKQAQNCCWLMTIQ